MMKNNCYYTYFQEQGHLILQNENGATKRRGNPNELEQYRITINIILTGCTYTHTHI
jgi:hypothetical protein